MPHLLFTNVSSSPPHQQHKYYLTTKTIPEPKYEIHQDAVDLPQTGINNTNNYGISATYLPGNNNTLTHHVVPVAGSVSPEAAQSSSPIMCYNHRIPAAAVCVSIPHHSVGESTNGYTYSVGGVASGENITEKTGSFYQNTSDSSYNRGQQQQLTKSSLVSRTRQMITGNTNILPLHGSRSSDHRYHPYSVGGNFTRAGSRLRMPVPDYRKYRGSKDIIVINDEMRGLPSKGEYCSNMMSKHQDSYKSTTDDQKHSLQYMSVVKDLVRNAASPPLIPRIVVCSGNTVHTVPPTEESFDENINIEASQRTSSLPYSSNVRVADITRPYYNPIDSIPSTQFPSREIPINKGECLKSPAYDMNVMCPLHREEIVDVGERHTDHRRHLTSLLSPCRCKYSTQKYNIDDDMCNSDTLRDRVGKGERIVKMGKTLDCADFNGQMNNGINGEMNAVKRQQLQGHEKKQKREKEQQVEGKHKQQSDKKQHQLKEDNQTKEHQQEEKQQNKEQRQYQEQDQCPTTSSKIEPSNTTTPNYSTESQHASDQVRAAQRERLNSYLLKRRSNKTDGVDDTASSLSSALLRSYMNVHSHVTESPGYWAALSAAKNADTLLDSLIIDKYIVREEDNNNTKNRINKNVRGIAMGTRSSRSPNIRGHRHKDQAKDKERLVERKELLPYLYPSEQYLLMSIVSIWLYRADISESEMSRDGKKLPVPISYRKDHQVQTCLPHPHSVQCSINVSGISHQEVNNDQLDPQSHIHPHSYYIIGRDRNKSISPHRADPHRSHQMCNYHYAYDQDLSHIQQQVCTKLTLLRRLDEAEKELVLEENRKTEKRLRRPASGIKARSEPIKVAEVTPVDNSRGTAVFRAPKRMTQIGINTYESSPCSWGGERPLSSQGDNNYNYAGRPTKGSARCSSPAYRSPIPNRINHSDLFPNNARSPSLHNSYASLYSQGKTTGHRGQNTTAVMNAMPQDTQESCAMSNIDINNPPQSNLMSPSQQQSPLVTSVIAPISQPYQTAEGRGSRQTQERGINISICDENSSHSAIDGTHYQYTSMPPNALQMTVPKKSFAQVASELD